MVHVRRKNTKCTVAMAVTKLEGLPPGAEAAVELRWERKRKGRLFPFLSRRNREIVSVSRLKRAGRDGSVGWEIDQEACRIKNASIPVPDSGSDTDSSSASSSGSDRDSLDASFSVLCGNKGQEGKSKENKLEVIGIANISLAEWIRVSKFRNKANYKRAINESFHVEETKRLPITLRIGYMRYDAMLYVKIKLVESLATKGSKIIPNLSDSSTELTDLASKSDKVAFFGRKGRSFANSRNDRGETENSESVSFPKQSFFWWRGKKKSRGSKESENNPINYWEKKEFICREAQTKLKTEVFFASIDQRDETAGGESACTALVAFLANYLLRKDLSSPTKEEIDELIRDGSSEWRKLCEDQALINRFPDKHFDLETIMQANIRPIMVVNEKSFIGFFQPESFKSLCGATSFDDIWNEIIRNIQNGEFKVYIISWNDHFFILKIENHAFYIVDTLGERLFEGCKNAYSLKFDDSSEMYKLNGKKKEELIFRGKECCKEFIRRFLAAIPLREELEIEKKGGENVGAPHLRLQIEFHFTILKHEQNLRSRYEDDLLRDRREGEFDRT